MWPVLTGGLLVILGVILHHSKELKDTLGLEGFVTYTENSVVLNTDKVRYILTSVPGAAEARGKTDKLAYWTAIFNPPDTIYVVGNSVYYRGAVYTLIAAPAGYRPTVSETPLTRSQAVWAVYYNPTATYMGGQSVIKGGQLTTVTIMNGVTSFIPTIPLYDPTVMYTPGNTVLYNNEQYTLISSTATANTLGYKPVDYMKPDRPINYALPNTPDFNRLWASPYNPAKTYTAGDTVIVNGELKSMRMNGGKLVPVPRVGTIPPPVPVRVLPAIVPVTAPIVASNNTANSLLPPAPAPTAAATAAAAAAATAAATAYNAAQTLAANEELAKQEAAKIAAAQQARLTAAVAPLVPVAPVTPVGPPTNYIAILYRLDYPGSRISYTIMKPNGFPATQIVVKLIPGPHGQYNNEASIINPVKAGMRIKWIQNNGRSSANVISSRVGKSNPDSVINNCIYIDLDQVVDDRIQVFYLTTEDGFQNMELMAPASIIQGFQVGSPFNSSPADVQSLEFRLGRKTLNQVQNAWLM